MTEIAPFDRWYVLASADAMAGRSYSTDEIVEAYGRGALHDRTVVYNRFSSRRDGLTVAELVKSALDNKKKKKR